MEEKENYPYKELILMTVTATAVCIALILTLPDRPAEGFMRDAYRSGGIIGDPRDGVNIGEQRSDFGHYDNGRRTRTGGTYERGYEMGYPGGISIHEKETFNWKQEPSRYHRNDPKTQRDLDRSRGYGIRGKDRSLADRDRRTGDSGGIR